MKHFYYVADWGSDKYLFAENVLISAASSWFKKRKVFMKWKFAPTVKRVFLDSGGFTFFKRWAEYPFSIETYVEFANQVRNNHSLEVVAILDYPCEENTVRSERLGSNLQRIEATVENAVGCYEADSSLPWIPVIQGYTLPEYLHCWDLYRERGIKADYWAIGSVCARKKVGGIRNILTSLKRETQKELHAFGLALIFIRDPQIWYSLFSSDSRAWSFMSYRDKGGDFQRYKIKIDKVFDSFEGQTTLEGY